MLTEAARARRIIGEHARLLHVDEGRKRVLLIAASIPAARKLSQYDGTRKVPATISAIADAIRWAEEIKRNRPALADENEARR